MNKRTAWLTLVLGVVFLAAITVPAIQYMGKKQPKLAEYQTLVAFSTDQAAQDYQSKHKVALIKTTLGYYKTRTPQHKLPKDQRISKLAHNYEYKAVAVPNDTHYSKQYAMPKTSAPAGWDITTGSSNVVIAVADTGFGMNHDDLKTKWWTNVGEQGFTVAQGSAPNCTSRSLALNKSCNNLDDDTNGYIDDWRGWDYIMDDNEVSAGVINPDSKYVSHGTMTASLAAAATNNASGIAGTCWSCPIMPLQVLGDDGIGDTVSVAGSIRYAADNGAKVISLSLGTDGPDATLEAAVNYALGKNVVIASAAGNSGPGNMIYPALYPGVISVGATDSSDARASWSSTGAGLDLTAPGVNVYSANWIKTNTTNAYTYASGTSMSTPLAAGAAGLLLSKYPSASKDEVARWLKDSLDKVPGMNGQEHSPDYGFGRLNIQNSLAAYVSLYASQSEYPNVLQGQQAAAFISYKNTGNVSWYDDTGLSGAPAGTKPVHLATSRPLNRFSLIGTAWGGDQNRPVGLFAAVYESDGTTLAANQHVAQPGQIAKFSFTIFGPTNIPAGTYREYFHPIVEGGRTMNDPGTFLDITITPAVYSSEYKAQSAYPNLIADNKAASAWVEYKNTGTLPWYDDSSLSGAPAGTKPVHLSTSRQVNRKSALGSGWNADQNRPAATFAVVYKSDGEAYATNPHIVQPGESARFAFPISAPFGASAGTYREYFQPILEGGSTMNDPGTFLDIKVDAAVYSSEYAGQCTYPSLTAGGISEACYVEYKNTGNVPWHDDTGLSGTPAGTKPVHLATSRPVNRKSEFGSSWNADKNRPAGLFAAVYESNGTTLASNQHVAQPGQIVRFNFTVSASAAKSAGSYREYFRPIVEGGSVMNDPGTFLDMIVE